MHRSQSAARSRRTAAALSRRQALGRLGGGVAAAALASLTPWHLTAPRTAAQVSPDPRLTGQVVLPSDTAYDQARLDFNQRFDVFPQAIVYCQSAGDVQNAIRWARAHGLPVTVRSGGHSYEAYSLGPGVVVDVSAMRTVQVDRAQGIAVAQPGIRLLDLYRTLAPDAVTVPGGTCAGVGLGGLTVGGGIGWLSRKWGLTCDNLLALQVVDGNGQLLTADAVQHADLFWALRGGGGSFGVVTSLTFQVHPIGDVVVFSLDWPFARAGPVLDAWQQVAPHWPDELTVVLEVHGPPDAGAFCDGLFVGDQGQLSALLEPLLRVAAPSRVDVSTVPYLDAAEHYADESQQPYFKAKSDYALAPLSPEAIAVILQFMAASPGRC